MFKQAKERPCRKRLQMTRFDTVDEIPESEWKHGAKGHVFLGLPYLRALARAGAPLCPVLFSQQGAVVGVAVFQVSRFNGAPLRSYLDFDCALLTLAVRPIHALRRPFETDMVVCGTPFAAGSHGYAFSPAVSAALAGEALARAAKIAQSVLSRYVEVSGVLFKEFFEDAMPLADHLGDYRYAAFQTHPAMVLPIDPAWQGFDDYLASLSSKYRVKAKRAFAKSAALVVRDLCPADLEADPQRVVALYDAVAGRAAFKLGALNIDLLRALREEMGEDFILKGYFYNHRPVGFWMGFVDGDTLEAGLVGIDYQLNKTLSVYPRMLYDYLLEAMGHGLEKVNYGRTAEEIKSTLGALPVPLSCALRLKKKTLNAVFPVFKKRLKPAGFTVRKPFKQEWYERAKAMVPASFLPRFEESELRG